MAKGHVIPFPVKFENAAAKQTKILYFEKGSLLIHLLKTLRLVQFSMILIHLSKTFICKKSILTTSVSYVFLNEKKPQDT